MNKDKKIAMQEKIIHQLQEEVKSLLERNAELEKRVNENEEIIKLANSYRNEHEKAIASLNEAREKYLQSHKEMIEQKNKYKTEMDKLLKTIKKNT